jgi:hypothetical protein
MSQPISKYCPFTCAAGWKRCIREECEIYDKLGQCCDIHTIALGMISLCFKEGMYLHVRKPEGEVPEHVTLER